MDFFFYSPGPFLRALSPPPIFFLQREKDLASLSKNGRVFRQRTRCSSLDALTRASSVKISSSCCPSSLFLLGFRPPPLFRRPLGR